jgi:hypothetical protein
MNEIDHLLATLPAVVMVDATQRFDAVAMPVPLRIEPPPHVLLWSSRLANEPGIIWLRELVGQVIAEIVTASERLLR